MYGYHVPGLEERHGRKLPFEMFRLVNYISFVAGEVVFLVGLFGNLEQCWGYPHTHPTVRMHITVLSLYGIGTSRLFDK